MSWYFCVSLTECGILSAITCPWAFLITVSLSAGDAVLQDIAIKNENEIKITQNYFKYFVNKKDIADPKLQLPTLLTF